MHPARSWVAVAVALAACGGSKKDAEGPERLDDALGSLVIPKVDEKLCDTTDKRVKTYDLNRDNRPDVWKIFATSNEGGVETEVMTCKQVDFDKDGVKDYVVTYRDTGQMTSEEADLTFDGRFDSRYHFDKKSSELYLIERDTDHDKKPDVWEKYDEDGRLESVRHDTNGDGEPDVWEQYVDGKLMAILYDDDYDSRVDRKEQVTTSRLSPPKPDIPSDSSGDGE